jgi:hypothetical protein
MEYSDDHSATQRLYVGILHLNDVHPWPLLKKKTPLSRPVGPLQQPAPGNHRLVVLEIRMPWRSRSAPSSRLMGCLKPWDPPKGAQRHRRIMKDNGYELVGIARRAPNMSMQRSPAHHTLSARRARFRAPPVRIGTLQRLEL